MTNSFRDVLKLEAGQYCTFVLHTDGRVSGCGKGSYGRLGLGDSSNQVNPRLLPISSPVKFLSSSRGSDGHTLALTETGHIYSWGDGDYGKLGHGNTSTQKLPKRVVGPLVDKLVVQISAGYRHSAAVTDDGFLYTWGEGDFGRLGHGDSQSRFIPTLVKELNGGDVGQVSCGASHTLALSTDGRIIWAFGSGDHGKLGHGDTARLYRPKTIDYCILPDSLKTLFKSFIKKGELSNMLFSGTPGIGKTTVAKALCEEMNCDWIMINGSEEGGIDVLRNKIKNFASTVSLSGGKKVVILDEADYLNPQSTQPALRGFMEEFHKNCGFILTCNYKNRLIQPLHSRCSGVDFKIPKGEINKLCTQFFKRVKSILDEEAIKYDDKVILELITKYFPDWRRTLNELQKYSVSGQIDSGILVNLSEVNINELMDALKNNEFTTVRKWIVNNLDNDPNRMFRVIYDSLYEYLDGSTIPHAVIIIGDYSYKSAFVADQEINMLACMTELMGAVKFK